MYKERILSIFSKFFPYILVLFIAIIWTNSVYHFGDINHIEQIPHILSKIEPNYLQNDFFVQYTHNINPRFYYSLLLAIVSKIIPLEVLFYSLTLLSNFLILVITYLVLRLFEDNFFLALFSLIVLINFKIANLGGAGFITDGYLVPQLIAMPFVLMAFLSSINGNFIVVSFSLFFSLFIQPSLTLLVAVPIIGNLMINPKIQGIRIKAVSLLVFLIIFTFVLFPNNTHSVLDSQKLIYILAYLRHPHHYIPSQFPLRDYKEFTILISLFFVSLIILQKSCKKSIVKYFCISGLLSLGLMLIGYVFVELFPIKQIVELQTFRIVFLLRWISVITISTAVYKLIQRRFPPKFINGLYTITIAILLVRFYIGSNHVQINLQTARIEERELLYQYISKNTPVDSVFLTPPDFGDMRTVAKRAIVVDWKSFPFNEKDIAVWYQRIKDCYGEENLDGAYRQIDDKKLESLHSIYPFQYVILDSKTNSNQNIIYSDKYFKLVKM